MTVSNLSRSRRQLRSDLLVALGGSEAYLTRSISERKILLEILETYAVTVSTRDVDDLDKLLARVVGAAGGTASHLRQNKHEMLAALVTALGGTAPSPYSSSTEELLAAAVNAADTGGGGGGYVAKAVHFDGSTALVLSDLSAVVDGPLGILSFWIKPEQDSFDNYADIVVSLDNSEFDVFLSPNSAGAVPGTYLDVVLRTSDELSAKDAEYVFPGPAAGWRHGLLSWRTNFPEGEKLLAFYLDDVLVGGFGPGTFDTGPSFDVNYSQGNTAISLGGNVGAIQYGPYAYKGDAADWAFHSTVSIVEDNGTISEANRRKFISAALKPQNPSGFPAGAKVLLSGDASAFPVNQGSAGALALTGSFTNATTSPSD